MRPLASLTLRWVMVAVSTVALLAVAAGMVRLLPWLLAPEVPLAVSAPFARTLLSVACEAAVIIGAPVGAAIAAAFFVERGEARALHALGVGPAALVLQLLPPVAVAAGVTLAALLALDVDATRPGAIARDLVAEGRASCERAEAPRSVSVPLVGVTWLCPSGHPPRATGSMPGTGGRVWFSAATFDLSEDLGRVELGDLRLAFRASPDLPTTRVHVNSANISGLAPWGRTAKLSAAERALIVVAIAWLATLALSFSLVYWQVSSRLVAVGLGAASGLTGLVLLHRIDQTALSQPAYLFAPLASVLAAPLVLAVAARLRAGVQRWRRRSAVAGLNAQ